MGNKNVDDYLTNGIYGTRLPKQKEREQYLGTLRERIVIALTIGQVMTDKGLASLEKAMQTNKKATLLLNGHVAYKFLKEEKALANKYSIPYTVITNEDSETEIGAVLTYDYAIDRENIYMEQDKPTDIKPEVSHSFFSKIKKWFTFS